MTRSKRQKPRPRPDVDDVVETPVRHPIQHRKTSRGGRMMPRPERLPCLDKESAPARRRRDRMRAGVHDETPLGDRLQPLLAERHPILVLQLFGHGWRTSGTRHQRTNRGDRLRRGLRLEIGVEPPMFAVIFLDFGRHQHDALGDILGGIDRLGFGAGTRQAHFPTGHASLLPIPFTPRKRASYSSLRPPRLCAKKEDSVRAEARRTRRK